MRVYVLVSGWPGSGKSTLARALAGELGLPLLAKDEIKEALVDGLGTPETVAASQRLGRTAVLAMLRVARDCPGAVLDSTWFPYTWPLLPALPGRLVEVCCTLPRELARSRYYARAATRHPGHLDGARDEAELWGDPPPRLPVGARLEISTTGPVDVRDVAGQIRAAAAAATATADFRGAPDATEPADE